MSNKKEIKRRIKSVKNIGQITKALQMVSAVKMRKAGEALKEANPYASMMHDMFNSLLADIGEEEMESFFRLERKKDLRDMQTIALIVIAPTRGFAGSLISNLARKSLEFIETRGMNDSFDEQEFLVFNDASAQDIPEPTVELITVEKKSREFAMQLQKKVIADFPKLSSPPVFEDIIPLSRIVVEGYMKGELDGVYILYSHFVNTFSQMAVIKRILPFNFDKEYMDLHKKNTGTPWYSYTSEALSLFRKFFPVYIDSQIYHSILDATAAEFSARMIAMQNATDNASDIRKELIFEYNQQRQTSITQEIAEIVSAMDYI